MVYSEEIYTGCSCVLAGHTLLFKNVDFWGGQLILKDAKMTVESFIMLLFK